MARLQGKIRLLGFLKFIGITPSFIDLVIGRILWRMFSYDYLRPRLLKKLKNISQVDIYRLSEKYVSSLKFQKDVLHYVRKYQSEGYEVVIVSATLHPIAKYTWPKGWGPQIAFHQSWHLKKVNVKVCFQRICLIIN
ncbi:hypothetical protein E5E93_23420 [Escherichia coli]|nr:hypothetical protein E5E93_23420 [Escherichia coli]